MAGNSFGSVFKLTTFGESHGTAIGGVIDGCPAGVSINFDRIQEEMDRRKPGQSKIVTQRKESDSVEFLSGIFEGMTTGMPIGLLLKIMIKNQMIIVILRTFIVQVMLILLTMKSMVNVTTEVADAAQLEKPLVVLLLVQLLNSF